MATARQIQVAASNSGLLKFDQDNKTAAEVTELLQKDLESHHAFFNADGFHNHIPHQLLALYGTGADTTALRKAFKDNSSYQQPLRSPKSEQLEELRADYASASPKYIGKGITYPGWLTFFQGEIDAKGGWEPVLKEYVFSESEAARDLRGRLFGGVLHPIIQLMYGVEWAQPAIVASALAQTAVHRNELQSWMEEVDALAAARDDTRVPLLTLFDELVAGGEHEKLRSSSHWDDAIKISNGVLTRAKPEALELMSRIKVKEEELEERTAEMVHAAAYVAASTTLKQPHVPKYDFFFIHHLNSAPIFLTLNKLPWIPTSIKARLLEWKMRLDLINYIARGCPPLQPDLLSTYKPRDTTLVAKPSDLLSRFHTADDDGHIIKVARSLMIAQEVSRSYADKDWLRIRDDGEWLAAHYLLVDGIEGGGATWVRQTGFPQAWEDMPEKTW